MNLLKLIRQDIRLTKKLLEKKRADGSVDLIANLDKQYRLNQQNIDKMRSERNLVSEGIGKSKSENKNVDIQIKEMKALGDNLKIIENESSGIKKKLNLLIDQVPNIPHKSVPIGNDETSNIVIREWGNKPQFSFKPLDHLAIGEKLDLFDFKRGAKISGSGFPLFKNNGAKLERALINSMINHHTENFNFEEIFPPVLILEESMRVTGQLPKFKEDMYHSSLDNLFLAPTAEVPVTNIHRNEILDEADLPINYVAYSPCFRRESGSYGKDTRGLLRVHQFNKVEMVKFCTPKSSYSELELLTSYAESILQKLNLKYRVIELCTGDLSFSASKCYDIEVWAPGENNWLEVSSCSNFEDFQSERGKIRYRETETKKVKPVHTLNGSGLATPRLFVALIETYQDEDGNVSFPDKVASFLGLKELK